MQQTPKLQPDPLPTAIRSNNHINSELPEALGQIFTSCSLANFMTGLVKEDITPTSRVLDPCIGPNTFFKAFSGNSLDCHLTGIELDQGLITPDIKSFFDKAKRDLISGSFFDLPLSQKFDVVIENPPYVRQELLLSGVNSKDTLRKTSSLAIPSKSNLYIYFLMKSIAHLEDDGILVAVIYDSWLYSKYGAFLKNSFSKLGHLERIYHFKSSAFDNADVGATVIKFRKNNKYRKVTEYFLLNDLSDINAIDQKPYEIKQDELTAHSFNSSSLVKTKASLFKPLKLISGKKIHRGTSAIVNSHFILSKQDYSEAVPIIKNVSRIKTYTVLDQDSYILSLSGSMSARAKSYIEEVKEKIINTPTNKYIAVKKRIQTNDDWYKVKLKTKGNFLFNYYLRKNIDFIYNPDKELSSDNFYSINIDSNELSYLAILNSSFTRLSILNNSRSQGNGLRKIQLYEFEEIQVVDCEMLSIASVKKLKHLGGELAVINRYGEKKNTIIGQIDLILLKEYNRLTNSALTIRELANEVKDYRN